MALTQLNRVALILGAASCALAPRVGLAQSRAAAGSPAAPAGPERFPLGFELSAGTQFPLEIGVEGVLEIPGGLAAHLGLGWMPRLYRDAINESAVSFGWYDDTSAALVRAALEDAFLISPSLGWRPPPLGGLEIYGGYVLAFLGGTLTGAEAERITGEELGPVGVLEVPLSGKAHGFQVGVAYQANLAPHFALRMSLAYFQLFDSSTGIDVDATVAGISAEPVVARVEATLDDVLRDIVRKYVKAPLLGIAIVYRF